MAQITYEQLLAAIRGSGWGGRDFLTNDYVIESASVTNDINGGGGLSLSWKSTTGGVLKAGTQLCGYILMNNYVPSLGNDGIFSWSPKFSEPAALLGKTPYFKTLEMIDAQGNTSESTLYSFSFCGMVSTVIEDIRTFLSNNMGSGWTVRILDDNNHSFANKRITITFDGDSVKSAVEKIADAAEGNCYFVGSEIRIGLTDAYADSDYYNRFVVLGGTKNMAKRTPSGNGYAAVTQRLMLDPDADVQRGSIIDLRQSGEAAMTRMLVFDDIYPKLDLTIRTVNTRLCYLLDEYGNRISDGNGGYKLYAKWYVTFANGDQPYTIDRNYMILDKPLGILFQSGPLTGREFELAWIEGGVREKAEDDVNDDGYTVAAGGEYRIILVADGDIILPTLPASYGTGGLCPNVGNWVTPINVAIEDSLKASAKALLKEKGMAMARIICSEKVPNFSEERSFADFITGDGTVPDIGSPVGTEAGGYVVTSVQRDIITGESTISYGTFSPKGLLSTTIDKVEDVSLNGGSGTTITSDVNTHEPGSGGTVYIYVPVSDGGGGTSSGGVNSSSMTTINEAGGNLGKKTVQTVVSENVFATLLEEIYNDDEPTLRNAVNPFVVSFNQSTSGKYQYYGGHLYKNGTSYTNDTLSSAMSACLKYVGDGYVTVYMNSFPEPVPGQEVVTPQQYDMIMKVVKFVNPSVGTDITYGGVQGWLYLDGVWKVILESSTGLIENLGSMIKMVVFGSSGGTYESAGMLTTQNFVELFARSVDQSGTTLAEAVFKMGIEYDEEHNPVSFAKMSADNIDFEAQNFTIDASHLVNIHAEQITFATDDFKISAGRINFETGQFTIDASHLVNINAATFTVDASHINFSGQTVDLTGSTLSLNADQINFEGRTVDLRSSTLYIDSDQLDIDVSDLDIKASDVDFNSQTVDLRSSTLYINSDQIMVDADHVNWNVGTYEIAASHLASIEAHKVIVDGETVTVSADSRLTFATGSETGKNDGVIDFHSANIRMNAEQINFTTGNFVINNGTEDTFAVDSDGDVTIRGTIYASSGEFTGKITAGDGTIGGWSIDTDRIYHDGSSSRYFCLSPIGEEMDDITGGSNDVDYIFYANGKFGVTNQGVLHAKGAYIEGNGTFTGTITANGGTIGGWTINQDYLGRNFDESSEVFLYPTGVERDKITDDNESEDYVFYSRGNFGVTVGGNLHAIDAEISGTIIADSGNIGDWKITSKGLKYDPDNDWIWSDDTIFLSGEGYSTWPLNDSDYGNKQNFNIIVGENFGVTSRGIVYAKGAYIEGNGTFTGSITAGSGQIGGWTIDANSLYHTNGNNKDYFLASTALEQADISDNSGQGSAYYLFYAKGNFGVTSGGVLHAKGAVVKGDIYANTGRIGGTFSNGSWSGGWTIVANQISNGTFGEDSSMFLSTEDISNTYYTDNTIAGTRDSDWRFTVGSKFGIQSDGTMVAQDAKITGSIEATNNKILLSSTATANHSDWYGLAVSQNITNPERDLATYGSRIEENYDYGRMILVRRDKNGNRQTGDDVVLSANGGYVSVRHLRTTAKYYNDTTQIINIDEDTTFAIFGGSNDQVAKLPSSGQAGQVLIVIKRRGGTLNIRDSSDNWVRKMDVDTGGTAVFFYTGSAWY